MHRACRWDGPIVDLNAHRGKLLVLTLGINHVIEQERLIISVLGSADAINWDTKPLVIFPQKSYCGNILNVSESREISQGPLPPR